MKNRCHFKRDNSQHATCERCKRKATRLAVDEAKRETLKLCTRHAREWMKEPEVQTNAA